MCSCNPGNQVLLLLSSTESNLLAKWQGPFEVTRHVGLVDYEVQVTGCFKEVQIYYVNLLKAWKTRKALFINPVPPEPELGLLAGEPLEPKRMSVGDRLDDAQREQLQRILRDFSDVLSAQPGWTMLMNHHIATSLEQKVRDNHRLLPKKMWAVV